MQNALLVSLSRQMALQRELDVVANNVANVNTNGFKARESRFQEFLNTPANVEAFPRPDRRVSYVIDAGTALDTSAGAIERTGSPFDVAVRGDGYLAVQTPNGERYTRDGALQLNNQGQLVTSGGAVVLGESGPIALAPNETGFNVGADGTVTTDQGQRGKIRLVRFANQQSLVNQGANLFSSTAAAQPAGTSAQLISGAVERSNVKPVLEMTRLMEVSRAYNQIATMISSTNDLQRTAISRLADVS